jgi:hypothetical protein
MRMLLLLTLPLLVAGSATAQAKALQWMNGPAGLPKGSKIAVVSGDPGKKGPFTIHLKFPANYAIPAHQHPTDENIRVVSGKLLFGMGDKADRKKTKAMAKGATGTAKAKMNHFVFTDVPTEVEVKAVGPFQITYANAKDDPRK